MSSFSSYCLNCLEAIVSDAEDEVAFCSLACQTRALLYVAEAQQREQQKGQLEGTRSTATKAPAALPQTTQTLLLPAKKTPFSHIQAPVPSTSSSSSSSYDSHSASTASRGQRPLRAAANGPSGSSQQQHEQQQQQTPQRTTGNAPSRPPLHSRYSVAIVNDLVDSLANPVLPAQQHPIMTSLRSGIFSVSSPTPTPQSQQQHQQARNSDRTDNTSRLERQKSVQEVKRSSTGVSPARSNIVGVPGIDRGAPPTPLLYYSSSLNPTHTGTTTTTTSFGRPAGSNNTFAPGGGHGPDSASMTSAYMDGDDASGTSASSAEAMYRQHYPKFANRRHLQDPSPNRSRMSDPNSMSSTMSDLPLLTPPSALRPLLYLPEPGETDCRSPRFKSIANPFADVDAVVKKSKQQARTAMPSSSEPDMQRHANTMNSSRTSPFNYIPERRSAPRRSLDISPSISQNGFDHHASSNGTTVEYGDLFSVSDSASDSTTQTVGVRSLDSRLPAQNSLGLEISHVERVATPDRSSVNATNDAPASSEGDENAGPPDAHQYLRAGKASKGDNPVSPPKCRSPLSSVYAVSGNGRLADFAADDGWRSVEASRYTLGPREASYIVRKLAEEQRKRQLKEKAAANEDPIEDRGRSRTRKRAGSWGNALERGQSRPCKNSTSLVSHGVDTV